MLRRNIILIALASFDMLGMDTWVMCHCLAIESNVKPVSQRKRKIDDEKMEVIDEEVEKTTIADFITEINFMAY